MTGFLHHAIPHLRMEGGRELGEFLTALEEILDGEGRIVVRLGGATVMADPHDMLIGPRGMTIMGTGLTVPFDATLRMGRIAPEHFKMPEQPVSRYRRTAFTYETGPDRTFGMIARDDDVEPGRHVRQALTEAIGSLRRTASAEDRDIVMKTVLRDGSSSTTEGVILNEHGLRAPLDTRLFSWNTITMFEIAESIRMTCQDVRIEIGT